MDRQALRVIRGETQGAAQVRVQSTLPPDLAGFTGRTAELDRQLGRYRPAADHFTKALTLFRKVDNRTGEATTLTNLGDVERRLGRHRTAADHYAQALTLNRRPNRGS